MEDTSPAAAAGAATADRRPAWGTAVVVGGSIAGSLVARVLSDHFERVVVVDADRFPDEPANRRGVPQGPHFHGLLARGRQVCEELFPGFVDRLVARGAPVTQVRDARIYLPYGWAPRIESDFAYVRATRPLLEWVIRDQAWRWPGVEYVPATTVVGLDVGGGRVRGVRHRPAGDDRAPEAALAADLVVDTTGRGGAGRRWLEAAGWPVPPSTSVNAHWGYASCTLDVPEGAVEGLSVGGFPLGPAGHGPTRTRGGHLMLQESGTWLLTLSGCARDHPPTDDDGFRAFAASLAFPDIAEVLEVAPLTSPVVGWRSTANRLFRYDELAERPEALVFVGDAVCNFNPVYGQGMTVAALGALDLRTELEAQRAGGDGGLDGLGGRFQARLRQTIAHPWGSACGADHRVPGVEGEPPGPEAEARMAFADRLVALGGEDPDVFLKLMETQQMIRSPQWTHDEALVARVRADWDRLGARMGLDG